MQEEVAREIKNTRLTLKEINMLLKCFIACTSCPPNITHQKYFPTIHLENNLSLPRCAQDVLFQNALKKNTWFC